MSDKKLLRFQLRVAVYPAPRKVFPGLRCQDREPPAERNDWCRGADVDDLERERDALLELAKAVAQATLCPSEMDLRSAINAALYRYERVAWDEPTFWRTNK